MRGEYSTADAMEKHTILPQLVKFVITGKSKYEVEQSVLQTLGRPTKYIHLKE